MKQQLGVLVIGAALLSGCGGQNTAALLDAHQTDQRMTVIPPPQDRAMPVNIKAAGGGVKESLDDPVATLKTSGQTITLRQLVGPLIEAHGLTVLVSLVELEIAKQNAADPKYHIVLTDKDFQEEHDRTLEKMFKDSDDAKLLESLDKAVAAHDADTEAKVRAELKAEREEYLVQFLVNQHVDRTEFDMVLKINAYLRHMLEIEWKDKITEDDVKAAFGQMYGERVRVRYILLNNMNDVTIAQRRLANGDSFEEVARNMSRDPRTAPLGGELDPFSHQTPKSRVPNNFRDAAFALRDGQVSDVVTLGNSFCLIKRLELLPPQAVKYWEDDDKPNPSIPSKEHLLVRQKLHDTLIESGMKAMKAELAREAGAELDDHIKNYTLQKQFDDNRDANKKAQEKAAEAYKLEQAKQNGITGPTTNPSTTQPSKETAPATTDAAPAADGAAAGERPPATLPGNAHQFVLPSLKPPTTQPATQETPNK